PLVFMTGMGKYLFTPLAVSVALALFASYVVSRTVSPLMCARFLRAHAGRGPHGIQRERFPRWLFVFSLALAALGGSAGPALNWVRLPLEGMPVRGRRWLLAGGEGLIAGGLAGATVAAAAVIFWVAPAFDRWFEAFTRRYERALDWTLKHRK